MGRYFTFSPVFSINPQRYNGKSPFGSSKPSAVKEIFPSSDFSSLPEIDIIVFHFDALP